MDPRVDEAFHLIPYGIYVLATKRGGEPCAMIVSWVSQVSYSPPLLMIALHRSRFVLPVIQQSGIFSLSLMRSEQKTWVARSKTPLPQPQFWELFSETPGKKIPILKDALACWECRLFTTVEAGDHVLIIAEVKSARLGREGKPLTTTAYGKTYIGQN